MDIETANAINEAIVYGVSAIQTVSPVVTLTSIGFAGLQLYKDQRDHLGTFTKMAVRSIVPNSPTSANTANKRRSNKIRKLVAATAMTSVALGAASFSFGAEDSFRNGQAELLSNVAKEANIDQNNTIVVTQGGTDTIMDSSQVPKDVVEDVSGTGIYVSLPKVSRTVKKEGVDTRIEDSAQIDSIMISMPKLESDTIISTGLLGTKAGDTIAIGGVDKKVDEVIGKENAPMRREVIIVSNDVAENVLNPTGNHDDDYFAAIIPGGNEKKIQLELDKKYGVGTFEAMSYKEFEDGTRVFMANNATVILLLFALATTAMGANYERSGVIDRIANKKKEISVLRALGCETDDAMQAELIQTMLRLGIAIPGGLLVANVLAQVANNINPGLNMGIDIAGDLTSAIMLMATVAAASGYYSGRKIVRSVSPASAMREV